MTIKKDDDKEEDDKKKDDKEKDDRIQKMAIKEGDDKRRGLNKRMKG